MVSREGTVDTQPTGARARLPALQRIISHLPTQAVLLMMLAIGFYALQDVCVKSLPSSIHLVEILFWRSVFALPILLLLVKTERHPNPWHTQKPLHHLLRALFSSIATLFFIASFRQMPLGDAYALTFSAPLFMALLGALLLKENPPPHRWQAVFMGFVGVWVICEPSLDTPSLYLIPLVGGLFHGLAQLSLRGLTKEDSTSLIVATLLGTSLFLCAPLMFQHSWNYSTHELTLFMGVGLLGGFAQWLMTHAFRKASLTFLAPFDYIALLWGIGFDFALWHHRPSQYLMGGTCLILGANFYLMWQERRHHKKQMRAAPHTVLR
ncbi:MAG: DMT family transporter [Alphaproteobacteria bacterium]|jgi:drug/metabolite transporter (DMT)-like permease|nr:DMT family transporter [Alphaproteobacteria bacterium]